MLFISTHSVFDRKTANKNTYTKKTHPAGDKKTKSILKFNSTSIFWHNIFKSYTKNIDLHFSTMSPCNLLSGKSLCNIFDLVKKDEKIEKEREM